MERAQRARVLTGVRRRLVACTRSPCTCLLQGGAGVCCPVETDSCRWPIHRPLWSETASRRSAGKTKTDWRSASRLQDPNCYRGSFLLSSSPRFVTFSFLILLVPSLGTFPLQSRTHCVGERFVPSWLWMTATSLLTTVAAESIRGCKRSESRTGKRQRQMSAGDRWNTESPNFAHTIENKLFLLCKADAHSKSNKNNRKHSCVRCKRRAWVIADSR